jgi:DNA-binding NarL/FixJ family response regulator
MQLDATASVQDHAADEAHVVRVEESGAHVLTALKLFRDGEVESALRRMYALRDSGALAQFVALLSPEFCRQRGRAAGSMDGELTSKQQAVLRLVRLGLENREIAELMRVSINTIKWHLKEMGRALGAKNRCSLIHIAESKGLI